MTSAQQILLIGSDGRTDAVATALLASQQPVEITTLSDAVNPGLLAKSKAVFEISPLDLVKIRQLIREVAVDLAIVGPEAPLAAGVTDLLQEYEIPCVGPARSLARIETSKSWAREILNKYGIAGNPEYRVFYDKHGLREYMRELGGYVIKPDGLTGGKGVRVSGDHFDSDHDGIEYATNVIDATGLVIIEERLDGEEFSLQSFTDGQTIIHCPIVQDHKRAFEGDVGPNTGGMGSYSCADGSLPFLEDPDIAVARQINERAIEAIHKHTGAPYRGILYGGFIATRYGVRLIEFNARLGDPEALNILPIIDGDFANLCTGIATGTLDQINIDFQAKATVCKYVVPEKYPSGEGAGDQISVSTDAGAADNLYIYWASAYRLGTETRMTGSRAVAFVGVGETLTLAEALAEASASGVRGNVRHRRDIGSEQAVARRVEHMSRIRA